MTARRVGMKRGLSKPRRLADHEAASPPSSTQGAIARGLPLGFVLTPGQAHDVKSFAPLFRMINGRIEALLADRGYDADVIRE